MKWSDVTMESLTGNRLEISQRIYKVLKRRIRSIDALEENYCRNNDWCLEIARSVSNQPKDWNLAIVEDAAYAELEGELCY